MNKRRQTLVYVLSDFTTAAFVWLLLNMLRYAEVAQYDGFETLALYLASSQVLKGQLLIPFFWLTLYYFSGYYNIPFGKSRIGELFGTLVCVAIGVTVIFFAVLLNDLPRSFEIYLRIFFAYTAMQFFLTYAVRFSITLHALRKMRRREWAPNVLVIGAGQQALQTKKDLTKLGYRIAGFVGIDAATAPAIPQDEVLGSVDDLPQLMTACPVDELVLAPDAIPDAEIIRILYSLYHYSLPIKVRMEKNNPLARGKVKIIHGIPFIEVTANNFSEAGKNIKHALDKVVAVLVLTLLSPMYACIAFRVKKSSPGPVFFSQERIGYMGRPFTIYKFRTMYADAGNRQGALLTERDDPRVTPFGRFLRKYRLDEFPQFWNVLKGDMSLVGPRPEQRYYIDRIVSRAPCYYLLHNVRPGITSWGMVKYGYADTVEKMIERLDYDIMYYENMSLSLDLTILAYTIKIVLTGKGV
ncbi:MAG: sugar transferase [Tannerella sp.]|jgi:exopolysaccharide biosynthesis polyprenyl glycosylphosphotransferase|nr:sugar transferase [Tannerella sp.]